MAIWDKINLNELSDNEIKGLIVKCTEIEKERKLKKQAELIGKLREAFYDVREANIRVFIHYNEEIELTALSCDDFSFD